MAVGCLQVSLGQLITNHLKGENASFKKRKRIYTLYTVCSYLYRDKSKPNYYNIGRIPLQTEK